MDLSIFLQLAVSGLLLGGIYALVAFGLSLIYGVVRILNFAHGTLLAVSGIAASIAFTELGVSPVISALVLMVVLGLLGRGFFQFLLQPLQRRAANEAEVGTVLVTVGALLIVSDVAAYLAGPTPRSIPVRFEPIEIGDVILSTTQLYALAGIFVLSVLLQLFLKRSWFGLAIRAVSQDAFSANLCAIPGKALHGNTFAFGCGLVAVAAVLYAMMFPVDPYMGFALTVKAFTIVVLGGIGNLLGTLAAGLLLGLVESMGAFVLGSEWAPAISIFLLLALLVFRPQGLFGSKSA